MRQGGDVRLRLDVELAAEELKEVGRIQDPRNPSVWGLWEVHQLRGKLQVVIPQSQWVGQILVGTEFEKTHIIELPAIPIQSCASVKSAFEELQQAVKLERQGFYGEAVSKCRHALDVFCEEAQVPDGKGGIVKRQKLKASWETRLGQRTYDWLNSSFGAIRGATNQSHHLSSTVFGQAEAQMLLIVTTAVVSYAVATLPET